MHCTGSSSQSKDAASAEIDRFDEVEEDGGQGSDAAERTSEMEHGHLGIDRLGRDIM